LQFTHVACEVLWKLPLYVPALQRVQEPALASDQDPALHDKQDVDPADDHIPAAQVLQPLGVRRVITLLQVPALHKTQLEAAAAVYEVDHVPALQLSQ